MDCRHIFWIGCLCIVLFVGCVSKAQLNSVSNDSIILREQLLERDKKLKTSNEDNKKCLRGQVALKSLLAQMAAENNSLYQKIEALRQAVNKRESIISIQESVIRLFDDSNQTLQSNIQEQITAQDLETNVMPSRIKLILVKSITFQPGSAKLSDEAQDLLKNMNELLQDKQYTHILVQGHTDNRPVKSTPGRNTDNWVLSVLRATRVVQYLHKNLGIAPERMSAIGFGSYRPIASNETAEGRQQNRRIEIILETQS